MSVKRIAIVGMVLLAGCFAIELDVNKEGQLLVTRQEGFFLVDSATREVKQIQKAEGEEKPTYARFTPDGKKVLTVSKVDFQTFVFSLLDLATKKPKKLCQIDSAANARFSPDGKFLAVVAASKDEDPNFKSQVPELYVVPTSGGAPKMIAHGVGVNFRWLPDSKSIVLLAAKSKAEDQSITGSLAMIDVANGKQTAKAAIIGEQQYAFDLSPDGKRVVFTAHAAGKVSEKLSKEEFGTQTLFEMNVATGAVKNLELQPKYAFYSPNGKSLLLGLPPEGFRLSEVEVHIADAGDVTKSKKVCEAAFPMAIGGEGTVYSGWINNESIYYFVERTVYGSTGKSLQLLTISTDGSKNSLLQPAIDTAAFQ